MPGGSMGKVQEFAQKLQSASPFSTRFRQLKALLKSSLTRTDPEGRGLSESVWQHVQRPHNPKECQHLAAVERNSWTTGLKHWHLHILKPNDASNSRLQWGGGPKTSFSVRTRYPQIIRM